MEGKMEGLTKEQIIENQKKELQTLAAQNCILGNQVKEAQKIAAQSEFADSDYATFKTRVGEAVIETLAPVQKKYAELRADDGELMRLMRSGAERAERIAARTLEKVYKKIGFVRG